MRPLDLLLTGLAPVIWGTTYIVTTEFLPPGYPVTVSMLRALPAGILLLLIVRQVPQGIWWARVLVLGALNFSIFFAMLFVAAYRLPGGVAATLGAAQPLIVLILSRLLLGVPIRVLAIAAALGGIAGVGTLILAPEAALDPVGVVAGLLGALSMAAGIVLTRLWQPPVSLLTFTAWQLTAGGLLLLPVALLVEPAFPMPTAGNALGLAWLSFVGAGFAYLLWFRGIGRLGPGRAGMLALLSPVTAVLIGVAVAGETLSVPQMVGMVLIFGSVALSQTGAAPAKVSAPRPVRGC